jgi:ribonuclease HI
MFQNMSFDACAPLASPAKAEPIVIYTDGGCSGNPGPGGWGVVVIADGDTRQLSGGEQSTTNNRMELTAAISALFIVRNTPLFAGRPVSVYSDSQYVKNGITGWITNWKHNGWKTANKKPVLNKDLWEQLDDLATSLSVSWNWIKGHAGVEYNEICDKLCQQEIAKNR